MVKDAGDDPDVTHGALILATVRRGGARQRRDLPRRRRRRHGHAAGLPIPPGEPAINPVPRADDPRQAIAEVASAHGDAGDVEVEIADPGRRGAGRARP